MLFYALWFTLLDGFENSFDLNTVLYLTSTRSRDSNALPFDYVGEMCFLLNIAAVPNLPNSFRTRHTSVQSS